MFGRGVGSSSSLAGWVGCHEGERSIRRVGLRVCSELWAVLGVRRLIRGRKVGHPMWKIIKIMIISKLFTQKWKR